MEKIIVIGGKGGAVVVAEQIHDANKRGADFEFIGFAFDDESFGSEIAGFPIVSKTKTVFEKFGKYEDVKFIFQLYRPDIMAERVALLNSYGIPIERFGKFVHPSVVISESAAIGYGTAIMANCVINSNAVIGSHCTVHSNSLIGHDTIMGDYNFVAAHNVIGSNNVIGDANFFGLNSTFNNYINIGSYCFVGMASNVIKGIESNGKVYGNPAKEFSKEIKPL